VIERYEIVNKYDDTPVGANPCVRPLDAQHIRPFGLKGQTHGSAPTEKYNRRSIRLPHYNYSWAGYYFITITAQNREHFFGEIQDGVMVLNVAGEMVHKWYEKLEEKFPTVKNDMMVIMPNHIHFIVQILQPVGANPCVRSLNGQHIRPFGLKGQTHGSGNKGQTHGSAPTQSNIILGDIIQWFKTMTTNTYIKMVKNNTLPPFNKRIWQRNYYEHVVRDENDYARIAEYIENNPSTWNDDMLNT